ncbi:MAG: hypothetical protein U0835_09065 [Isosphaeraceae bacterium]
MSEPTTETVPPSVRPRRKGSRVLAVIGIVGAVIAVTVPVVAYVGYIAYCEQSFREAVAEADRLDPGWRLEEILSRRDNDPIPEAEDAAATVLTALDELPEGWGSYDPKARAELGPLEGVKLLDHLTDIEPDVSIAPDVAEALADEIEWLRPALRASEPLAGQSRGRFPFVPARIIFETLLPNTQNSRTLVRVLQLSAYHKTQTGDLDGAIDECRRMVGVSHAIGDEPTAISQLVRLAEIASAVVTLERVLAQGEPSDTALKSAQERFRREAGEPFALIGLRGERAASFDVLGKLASGEAGFNELSEERGRGNGQGRFLLPHARAFFRYNQSVSLLALNQAVEAAKQPPDQQTDGWNRARTFMHRPEDAVKFRAGSVAYLLMPALDAFWNSCRRVRGELAVAQAMAAMERTRRATGRWPESLDAIPKSILPASPIDPFSGRPVRTVRTPEGWVVYCVGADGEDNGGRLDPKYKPDVKGFDWGRRLWDVSRRGRPPAQPPANPTEDQP